MKIKTILPVIIIIVCISALWGAYRKIDMRGKTFVATHAEVEETVAGECLTIKNEYPIRSDAQGFFQNSVADSSRVFCGQGVGYVYMGEIDPELINSLNLINEKLREAQLAQNSQKTLINDTLTVDNTILSYTSELSELGSDKNQQEINKVRHNIDTLLHRKQNIAQGDGAGNDTILDELLAKRVELEKSIGECKKNVSAPASGLFLTQCDGLEDELNLQSYLELTPQKTNEYIQASQKGETDKQNMIAKVASNNKWVLAMVCDKNKAEKIEGKRELKIRLKAEGEDVIGVRIAGINYGEDDKAVVFVAGTKEIDNIYGSRRIDAEILINDYEGLKVLKNAVLSDENGKYVNVLSGSEITKKYVDIIYEDEDYVIVAENNAESGALRLYDEVISE